MSLYGGLHHLSPSVTLLFMKLLVTLIGLILVIEGLPYVASPEAMQRWLKQLAKMKPSQLRMMGLIAMIGGFVILFFARRSGLLG